MGSYVFDNIKWWKKIYYEDKNRFQLHGKAITRKFFGVKGNTD